MGLFVETQRTVPSTAQSAQETHAPQTSPEDVWNSLLPMQKQVVIQTIVQVCHQLMQYHKCSEKEATDDQA
jgi:hypothetical protein